MSASAVVLELKIVSILFFLLFMASERACLLAVGEWELGLWLQALPSSIVSTMMDDAWFRLATCLIQALRQIEVVSDNIKGDNSKEKKLLETSASDILKATYALVDGIEFIKQNHLNSPAFEVGYVMFTLFEKYRKMVDKYNTSITMNRMLYTVELLMYLEEIETHHWEVEHLANMLHEIERKYNVTSELETKYREMTSQEKSEIIAKIKAGHRDKRLSSTRKYKIKQKVLDRLSPTTPHKKLSPFPADYGWEVNYVWRKK